MAKEAGHPKKSLGTILVVDDEPQLRDVLRRFFSTHGFQVVVASNGSMALALLKKAEVDAVLLDMNMPGMDGLKVLSALRDEGSYVPVFMLTGNRDMGLVKQAVALGACEYILKPVDLFDLERRVRARMTKARKPATPAAFLENLSQESAGTEEFLSFVDEAVGRSLGAAGGKRRRIAVIDDEPGLVEVFTHLLEPDHDVLSANSGTAGLALILANKPDLVLLDVRMPGMDGIEVLERVKMTFPALPVLLVTAVRDLNLSKRAMALGASGYILKPFDVTRVRELVEKVLPSGKSRPSA